LYCCQPPPPPTRKEARHFSAQPHGGKCAGATKPMVQRQTDLSKEAHVNSPAKQCHHPLHTSAVAGMTAVVTTQPSHRVSPLSDGWQVLNKHESHAPHACSTPSWDTLSPAGRFSGSKAPPNLCSAASKCDLSISGTCRFTWQIGVIISCAQHNPFPTAPFPT
jgi:hypothetical protein